MFNGVRFLGSKDDELPKDLLLLEQNFVWNVSVIIHTTWSLFFIFFDITKESFYIKSSDLEILPCLHDSESVHILYLGRLIKVMIIVPICNVKIRYLTFYRVYRVSAKNTKNAYFNSNNSDASKNGFSSWVISRQTRDKFFFFLLHFWPRNATNKSKIYESDKQGPPVLFLSKMFLYILVIMIKNWTLRPPNFVSFTSRRESSRINNVVCTSGPKTVYTLGRKMFWNKTL